MNKLFELKKSHCLKKHQIQKRLLGFRKLRSAAEKKIFEELCFCLLTAGANAENCKNIIENLKKRDLLLRGRRQDLWPFLKYARFYNQKAHRIVEARRLFQGETGKLDIKSRIFCADPHNVRKWLIKHVKGLGYKEASHFLRNVGLGEEFAILDRHILKRLKKYGIINRVPASLSAKNYLEIEARMREFSRRSKIPLSHMDILFFSDATGKAVKHCK